MMVFHVARATARRQRLLYLATALELIRSRRVPVAEMITHSLPLGEAQEGFRLVGEGAESLKVILLPQDVATE